VRLATNPQRLQETAGNLSYGRATRCDLNFGALRLT